MARELIEVNPSDESSLPSRERTNRGREPYARTPAGYREIDSARTPEFSDSVSSNYSRKPAERGRRRAQLSDDIDPELAIDLDQDDEERFLRTSRRVPVRRSALPKKLAQRLRLGAAIAAVVLVAGGAGATAYGYGMHSWRFRITSSDNVEISGVHNASRAHVMEVAGADIGRNVLFVPLEERKRQLEQIPWVESATVMRLLPNRIAVTIEERTPIAFAQIGPRISLIDANGVIMGMPANRQTKYSFPVIRGISDTEPLSSRAAAMKIYNHMAQELDSGGDGARYTRQLSEVDLSDPEDVKVIANDAGGTLLIHLGSSNFLERYKLYLGHIAEWRQQFQSLQSVDLRYDGQIIVNPDVPPVPKVEKPAAQVAPAKDTHHVGAETRRKHWKKKK
jgi:cell division protein FtsQ